MFCPILKPVHCSSRSNIFSNPVTASPTTSLLDGARRRLSEGAMSSGNQPAGLPSPDPHRGPSSQATPLRLPQVRLPLALQSVECAF